VDPRARDEEKLLYVRTASNSDFLVVKHVMFLAALVKLRKVAINLVLSVRLSVQLEELGYRWADFHEIWYLRRFRRIVEKMQVCLKSDKNKDTVHDDLCTFIIISR
jgi:hypothetical protein